MTTDLRSSLPRGAYVEQSYAQWVRRAIALARGRDGGLVSLFESSVPEPRALLRQVVADLVEPDFGPSYVSAFGGGNPVVLDLLAARYGVARGQVLGTTGATGALSLIYRAFARPGDHVLIETPGFDLFQDLAVDHGLHVDSFVRPAPSYRIDPAAVEARMRPDTRLIVLSNLHNPSGMLADQDTLTALARIAERWNALLVVDEVYGDYAAAVDRPAAAASLSSAVLSVSSLTKIFGLAALRCGWVVGSPAAMEVLRDHAGRVEFGLSNLAHAVAAEVMRDPAPFQSHADGILARARPILMRWAGEMTAEGLIEGELPAAGCIYFPRLTRVADSEAFAASLIARRGIIVAPGEYFGAPGHIRIGFGLEADRLEPALAALAAELHAASAGPAIERRQPAHFEG